LVGGFVGDAVRTATIGQVTRGGDATIPTNDC
jgi:hypothetical protein